MNMIDDMLMSHELNNEIDYTNSRKFNVKTLLKLVKFYIHRKKENMYVRYITYRIQVSRCCLVYELKYCNSS